MSYIDRPYRVSVAMGIYNCAATLADSIESLLTQTYKNWELIMCDDASSDETLRIAQDYELKYNNIKVLRNDRNMGLAATLNRCIENACSTAEFIARQDGDDLSEPDRFEVQVRFLDEHPEYAMVSTAMTCFDEFGDWGLMVKPQTPTAQDFAYSSPFCHAAIVMRRKALASVGNYTVNKYLRRGQDFYLWHKFYVAGYCGYNIQEPYYKMRDDRAATKRRRLKDRIYGAKVHLAMMKNLKLPFWNYPRALRTIIVGLLPNTIYERLHRKSVSNTTTTLKKQNDAQ